MTERSPAGVVDPGSFEGVEPSWSRLVTAPDADGVERTWHVLDNAGDLASAGAAPVATIVCVHGNPTWSYLWRSVLAAASAQAAGGGRAWRVVAVDQLDMGWSERTGTRRRLAQRVRDLDAVVRAAGVEGPVVTLGHDWGGVVSLGWAVDHRDELLASAVLNTAVHQPEGTPVPAPLRLALARGVHGLGTERTTAFLDTTLALAHPRLTPGVRAAYRAPYRTAARRGGIAAFVADIPVDADHPSAGELDRIAQGLRTLDVPALALWGPRDPIFSDRYLDDLRERLPHLDVHRFEGAGHLLAEDVDVAGAVLTWLGDVADRREDRDASPAADARPAREPATARLWAHLDALRDDEGTALVEMAPPRGAGPRTVSWRLLARRVDEIARGLHAFGVRPGDRVSLLVPPGADLTGVLYACLRLGAVVVVADAGLGLRGLTRAVRGARPDVVVGAVPGLAAARALGWPGRRIATHPLPRATTAALGVETTLVDLASLGAAMRGAPLPEPAQDDVAAVLFTSGSTGPAKGVVYTHAQLGAVRDALAARYGIAPGGSLVAGFAPFALLGPALGARTVTPDMDVTAPRTLTARALADAVAAADARVVFLSPAAVANVVATADALGAEDRAALAGVGTFLSAGAPVSLALLDAVGRLMPGAEAHTPYGMTEGLLMTDVTAQEIRAAQAGAAAPGGVCVGRPVPGVRVRVSALDGDGRAVGELTADAGVTGEVVVDAPHVKDRYDALWLTERASRRTAGPVDGAAARTDGARWHRTGDVGHLDAAGRLWIEGRLAHVVTTPDGVVTPVGPEQAAEQVAQVHRAAVVGVGPAGVQQLVVVVETVGDRHSARRRRARPRLAGPGLAEQVRERLRERVPASVAAVLVVPVLPTDVRHNSKVDRARVAAWAEGVLSGGRMVAP
ncbi:acyl-CoA synthetase (AMP-forming)/AMP-acid ligase II [Cellulomonas sp. PhB143]|nr:alpha/beta fold hydrolase [Cellulomonas sp. PhB143]ROS74400.1 acyl-CoA synthetase (AMP-forming)/AMP-acid ligase II [Cellulomonas sp. PhB143]